MDFSAVEMRFAPFIHRMLEGRKKPITVTHARVPYAVAICGKAGVCERECVMSLCVCVCVCRWAIQSVLSVNEDKAS